MRFSRQTLLAFVSFAAIVTALAINYWPGDHPRAVHQLMNKLPRIPRNVDIQTVCRHLSVDRKQLESDSFYPRLLYWQIDETYRLVVGFTDETYSECEGAALQQKTDRDHFYKSPYNTFFLYSHERGVVDFSSLPSD